MSEAFYISIAGIGAAFVTGIMVSFCRGCLRFKCSSMDFCGMTFERNIELENEAQIHEFQSPSQPVDVIPRNSLSLPPSRRHSII